MKNIPPIVWQVAALGVVAVATIYALRRIGGSVKDAYSPGGVAYEAGNTVQDAIIPGVDSLGTWLYGLFNRDPEGIDTTPSSSAIMGSYAYPGGYSYPAREGSNPFLPDYVQGYGYSPETGNPRAPAGTGRNTVTRR